MNHEQINPFDNEAYAFLVLINSEEQYSLWPDIRPVPAGCRSLLGRKVEWHVNTILKRIGSIFVRALPDKP